LKRIGADKDPHLLTYGRQTYSSDARFQIIHEKPNNWKLQIQFTKRNDEGLYECQVSTNPPLIQYTYINVVGKPGGNIDRAMMKLSFSPSALDQKSNEFLGAFSRESLGSQK
jgi:hypothetical protein